VSRLICWLFGHTEPPHYAWIDSPIYWIPPKPKTEVAFDMCKRCGEFHSVWRFKMDTNEISARKRGGR
jgi:hypothetical protein